MNLGFWQNLISNGKPIMGLSPMDGVTDVAMRYMTGKYGRSYSRIAVKPSSQNEVKREHGFTEPRIYDGVNVMFSEFVSVDALAHAKEEKSVDRVMRAFLRSRDVESYSRIAVKPSSQNEVKREHGFTEPRIYENWPYEVAQVFGHTPELFYQAAVIIATLGFDGMDINMGCPMHKVEDQGSGAGLIRTPELAQEIVRQAKQGMQDYAEGKVAVADLNVSEMVKEWVQKFRPSPSKGRNSETPLPVSVKTRIGVKEIVVEWWVEQLMEVEPAMISLHGRTLKQLYQGSADWEAIGRAAEVVHKLGGHILGNGDIQSIEDGMSKVEKYGVDGFLIGRAAEGNPGVFKSQISNSKFSNGELVKMQQIAWMIEHAKVYDSLIRKLALPVGRSVNQYSQNQDIRDDGETAIRIKEFMPMRKHLAWYCKGFPGAGELRSRLVMANSVEEVEEIIGELLK